MRTSWNIYAVCSCGQHLAVLIVLDNATRKEALTEAAWATIQFKRRMTIEVHDE